MLAVPETILLALAASLPPAEGERPDAWSLNATWTTHVGDLPSVPFLAAAGPKMKVPSNWFQQGLEHAGVVWFLREVELPRAGGQWALEFDGVDYQADVYWDGISVGSHRGYFAPFRIELPNTRARRPHVLAVRVYSPKEEADAFSLRKRLIKGVLSHHDTRPGGAWSKRGQDANTGGIWGDVRLVQVYNGTIDQIRVSTRAASDRRAVVEVSARASTRRNSATLRYRVLDRKGTAVASGRLGVASTKPRQFMATVALDNPERWWPLGFGEPSTYRLELTLHSKAGTDRRHAQFGIRTIRQDNQGRIRVNDVPIFIRGTNYIPTLYYAGFSEDKFRRDLELMQAAHINAIRVHAHVASKKLYHLTDTMGFLVQQDFPLQWGYEDSPEFVAEAKQQLREMVDHLHCHPSIFWWTAHNEAPWSSDWMVWKYPDWDSDQNRALDEALGDVLYHEDPSRPSQTNSHPAEHAWMGWYSGSYEEFGKPMHQPFLTEYGAQAVPNLPTLKTILPKDALWPIEGKNLQLWQYHNFQLRELTKIAKVPLGDSVDDLIDNTQSYQAKLTQFAAESMRRQKWQPVAGIFQFMFVEHWPSINWGVLDYLRKPKKGYTALARAYQPLLVVASPKKNREHLHLYVINDTLEHHRGLDLSVQFKDGDRRTSQEWKWRIDAPDNRAILLKPTVPYPNAHESIVLRTYDAAGGSLSENRYEPGFFAAFRDKK